MYNPGRNRIKIKVYSLGETYTVNELGEYVPDEALKFEDWAEIKKMTGKELLEQRKAEHVHTIILSLRYRKSLTLFDIIKTGDRTYTVEDIAPMGRYMEVICQWKQTDPK